MNIKQKFTAPKLCNRKGDLRKDWFVYFYFTDRQTGVKKLCRYKLGINRFKTKKERELEAEIIKAELISRLKNNWNPISEMIEADTEDVTLLDALDQVLLLKKPTIKKSSYDTYSDQCRVLTDFLKKKRLDKLMAYNFTHTYARDFFDHLLLKKGWSATTFNNHLTTIHGLFEVLVKRKIIKINPCTGIEKIRVDVGKNTTYSKDEERRFIEHCKDTRRLAGFYLATRFVKYCFLRRPELHGLRVGHINLKNKTIVIPSSSAKSRIQDSITIPKTMEDIIIRSGIMNLDPEMYVFGRSFKPSTKRLTEDNVFTYKQGKINKSLNIKKDCTFYSWKHTGTVELYNLTKDPYAVMRQCRHKDLTTTMRYLRSLGCGVNEQVREW